MYRAIEAEIHPDGSVTLCESVHPRARCRAIVTILQPLDDTMSQDDGSHWLDDLWNQRLPVSEPIIPLSREEAQQR